MLIDSIKIKDSFVTGSRVYGFPSPDSDYDLVVLVEDTAKLWEMAGPCVEGESEESCRFGKLNLITFSDPNRFEQWKQVTESLYIRRPVTRDEAVAAFKEAGFDEYGD